jgi:hypothetical protein
MAVFRNREEDSELRIAAYLATMTCPSNIVMSKVRYLLESEEVNQVGSFVVYIIKMKFIFMKTINMSII